MVGRVNRVGRVDRVGRVGRVVKFHKGVDRQTDQQACACIDRARAGKNYVE